MVWVGLLVAMHMAPAGMAAGDSSAQILRFGLGDSFFPDISRADIVAAIEVLGKRAFEKESPDTSFNAIFLSNPDVIQTTLEKGDLEFISLRSCEILQYLDLLDTEQMLFLSQNGSVEQEYVVLVGTASSIQGVGDLKGASLTFDADIADHIAVHWLDTLIMRGHRVRMADCFSEIKTVSKASTAVLSVFFGQKDAVLTTRSAFKTMKELNPQLGTRLREIAVSSRLIPNCICWTKKTSVEKPGFYVALLEHMHERPEGAQILTSFGVDRIVHGSVGQLDSVRELMKQYEEAKQQLAASPVEEGGDAQ